MERVAEGEELEETGPDAIADDVEPAWGGSQPDGARLRPLIVCLPLLKLPNP